MQNKKRPVSVKRQSVCKHSAVPLSVALPLREAAAHRPPSRADALTGITRPHLLASSFSRRLQGDFHPPLLSASHRTAALFAGLKGLLVLIHAKLFNYRIIIPRFGGLSTVLDEFFPENRGKPPLFVTDSGTAGRCTGRCRPETSHSCKIPAAVRPPPRERRPPAAPYPPKCAKGVPVSVGPLPLTSRCPIAFLCYFMRLSHKMQYAFFAYPRIWSMNLKNRMRFFKRVMPAVRKAHSD